MSKPCLILLYILFLQMSQTTKLILEQRIEVILAIMSQDVMATTEQNMLEQALEKEKVSQAQSFSDLRTKKKSEDVITVDESPDVKQGKPKKKKNTEKPTDKGPAIALSIAGRKTLWFRSMIQGTPTMILTKVLLSVLQKKGALKANQRDLLERDVITALDQP